MLVETARFRPDDPDPLVQASFCCACCLREPATAAVAHGADGSTVRCHCDACDRSWTVLLTPEQGLRLQLRPPWGGMSTVARAGSDVGGEPA
ncbi:MAG TPA: hypothetical protein VFR97_08950 [Capillimicrobium sp.]|nr:hypothetical protein [Capillimicrobium sp.]